MANGNSVNHWHSYGNWSVSTSGKTATVTLTVGMASESWGFSLSSGVTATATIDGTSGSASGGFGSGTGQSVARSLKTVSKSFTRGHSAQGKSVSWRVVNASGYMNGTSSGSGTATIPALGSHTVTFNANGGSGGPSSTTKWEYEDLAIPSTVPTRANYRFLGWSTSPTGTAAYEAGKTYGGTPDSNYTLYAVWKLMYVPPSFTGALALRTGDATATVENPTGNYAYASFTWKVDTTVYSSNKLKSIACVYYKDGSTTPAALSLTGTTSGTSGTVNAHFAADNGSAYRVVCTATDTQGGSTSAERSVAAANFPLEIANRGKGIGLLHSAPAEGISLGGVTLTGANGVSGSYPMSTLKSVLDNARYVSQSTLLGGPIGVNESITDDLVKRFRVFAFENQSDAISCLGHVTVHSSSKQVHAASFIAGTGVRYGVSAGIVGTRLTIMSCTNDTYAKWYVYGVI